MSILIILVISMVILPLNADEGKLEIETPNSGFITSTAQTDVYVNYTSLATYGIHPTTNKSITFQVKACHDASMLLSSASDLKSENLYEVVFGASNNMNIILRRKSNEKRRDSCVRCLSCDEYNTFTVKWSTGGTMTIMKGSKIHLKWIDNHQLPVNGIGIATGWGATGSWVFQIEKSTNGSQKETKERMCPCSCNDNVWSKQNFKNYSRRDLEKLLEPKLDKIKQELRLNKFNLSLNRRKRTSAHDNRKSSKQIGIMAVVFLAFVGVVVVLIDVTSIRRKIHHTRRLGPHNS